MMMKIIGKRIIPAILSFAVIFAATGCQNTTANVSQPQESASSAIQEENGIRTVSTVMGDIKVPVHPKNVVVNWYIGDVYAAGLNVSGYYCWAQKTMPFYDKMMATKNIEKWEPEEVMALEPDLIVTYDKEDFEKFGKIAPVLVIEESVPSEERVKIIGEATGMEETANQSVAVFKEKLANAQKTLQTDRFQGKTFSILEDWGPSGEWSGIGYETGSRGGTLMYHYLGLKYPDKLAALIESSKQQRGNISYEVAHEYFGDYILWCRQEGKDSEYMKSKIWKSIPAVAAGHVIEVPGEYQGLFFYSDVLSLTEQIDFIDKAFQNLKS
ncbi:MAG: ABC transporter substrate-binding protein [Clostridium sp.]|uniref:ABC transporter substrate-binding protein n=1 Tax=Clostridium sp. TaxID=1506 RepID=UPI00291592B3|nr:ABC transporter substrate-binding protein [Clostridium sp.]MDU7339250.1 ABC transporter substrate-binding protein [Clostridium sp.]